MKSPNIERCKKKIPQLTIKFTTGRIQSEFTRQAKKQKKSEENNQLTEIDPEETQMIELVSRTLKQLL